MAPHRQFSEPKSHGSGTGPQTPTPHKAASCGHDAHARTPGPTAAAGDRLACACCLS